MNVLYVPTASLGGINAHTTDRKNSTHSGTILCVSSLKLIRMEHTSSPDATSFEVRTGHCVRHWHRNKDAGPITACLKAQKTGRC
jgi:hypothetical protein